MFTQPEQTEQTVILVIDDEEAMRDSCRQVLTREGYNVEVAIDGVSGLRMASDLKPDMVLLDLKMPGISGQDVLERIGDIDKTISTVVITGYATISAAVESMRYGACDFLPKPFTPNELRSVVRRSLERRRNYLEAARASKEKAETARYFLSMIPHEVVTPLKEVRKSLSQVETQLPSSTPMDLREKLAYCSTSVERIIRLVEKWRGIVTSPGTQEEEEAA